MARRSAQHTVCKTNRFAIVVSDSPLFGGPGLRAALQTELQQAGFNLVAPAEAEYRIACQPGAMPTTSPVLRETTTALYTVDHPAGLPTASYRTREWADEARLSEGIWLVVWPVHALASRQPEAAWEAFILSGSAKPSPERQRRLIRTLLNYLGENCSGYATLAQ